MFLDQYVRYITEDLLSDTVMKTGHDSKNNNQRSNTKSNPGDGNKRNHRDKGLFTLGAKVAQADKEFVVHKDQAAWNAERGTRKIILGHKGSTLGPRTSHLIIYFASGRICGKRIKSRIDWELVNNITRRSIPMPSPAVGGRPCSNARI